MSELRAFAYRERALQAHKKAMRAGIPEETRRAWLIVERDWTRMAEREAAKLDDAVPRLHWVDNAARSSNADPPEGADGSINQIVRRKVMRRLKKIGFAAVATLSLVAASCSADARNYNPRGWRGGYQSGTVVATSLVAATWPYYGYRRGYWYWEYAPAGPFVDYPYRKCRAGLCWY